MLSDRPVFVGIASGGSFTGERANQPDFLTPYLSAVLGSIGLKILQYLPMQATAFLEGEQAILAREKALAAIDLTVVGEIPWSPTLMVRSDAESGPSPPLRPRSAKGQ
jgi:FMN-dependent NADH-azoreductase